MVDRYLHQQCDGRIVEMSDRACRVSGVTYRPRWPWSPDYREWFRACHSHQDTPEADARRTRAYNEWLRER